MAKVNIRDAIVGLCVLFVIICIFIYPKQKIKTVENVQIDQTKNESTQSLISKKPTYVKEIKKSEIVETPILEEPTIIPRMNNFEKDAFNHDLKRCALKDPDCPNVVELSKKYPADTEALYTKFKNSHKEVYLPPKLDHILRFKEGTHLIDKAFLAGFFDDAKGDSLLFNGLANIKNHGFDYDFSALDGGVLSEDLTGSIKGCYQNYNDSDCIDLYGLSRIKSFTDEPLREIISKYL